MATSDSPPTSPELLAWIASGDPRAWEPFVARYASLIDAWCRRAGLQLVDAEDVRSRLLKNLVTALVGFRYDPTKRFRGYLRTSLNNELRKFFAERSNKPGNFGRGGHCRPDLDELADANSLLDKIDDSVNADLRLVERIVSRVRARLSPDQWAAFQLTVLEGKTGAEAAALLGKSVAAVYMAKCRVAAMLHDEGERSNE